MENIQEIFKRYLEGTCTAEELRFLFNCFREGKLDSSLMEQLEAEFQPDELKDEFSEDLLGIVQRNRDELRQKIRKKPSSYFKPWISIAATLLILSAVTFYFYPRQAVVQPDADIEQVVDVAPGTSRATLTLADGQKRELSSVHGSILIGDNITYPDGTVVADETTASLQSMSVSTPRGGQYQVLLPDGTRVWLNADSRLTYPSHFNGKYRQVELEGEGYFEVEKNTAQPFVIVSQGQQIEVLGTEFNVTAYPAESETITTLVNGSVKVSTPNEAFTLRPGQQAVQTTSGVTVQDVDVSYATGWKDGFFVFQQTSLREVLMNLSRWYDIAVDTVNVAERAFNGRISRTVSLQQVLRMMEKSSDLKFHINEERRLSVMH